MEPAGRDPGRAFGAPAVGPVTLCSQKKSSSFQTIFPPVRGQRGRLNDGLATGCQWQALPKDRQPKSTAHHYFMLWDWDGTLERIHEALYVAVRVGSFIGTRNSPGFTACARA
jgi:Putative transposase of IS4/5 family (DUF4096)